MIPAFLCIQASLCELRHFCGNKPLCVTKYPWVIQDADDQVTMCDPASFLHPSNFMRFLCISVETNHFCVTKHPWVIKDLGDQVTMCDTAFLCIQMSLCDFRPFCGNKSLCVTKYPWVIQDLSDQVTSIFMHSSISMQL